MDKWTYRKEHHKGYRPHIPNKPWHVYAIRGTYVQKLAEFSLEAAADALLAHLNREE